MNNENQIIKSSPKDVFMHLLNMIALYASATSILVLLFQYINIYFPDILNPYFDPGSPMRGAIASLIIIFPVFILTSKFIQKDIEKFPQKSELKIRKWLLYFTLFIAAIIIIGDLVSLIYNFLQGELTIRFFLKIISVLAVAASIFGYYLYELRRKPGIISSKIKIFTRLVIAIVAVIVIVGFFIAGSPFKQRLVRFDRERINDLQMIQGQIVNFWINKEKLPASLNDLKDNISGFVAPVDPETGNPYEYRVKGNLTFELCANFNFTSKEGAVNISAPTYPRYGIEENWNYSAGRVCFERTIDPDIYKPKNVIKSN
jgi:competence protein ComGC